MLAYFFHPCFLIRKSTKFCAIIGNLVLIFLFLHTKILVDVSGWHGYHDFHGWLTLLWQTVVFASLVFFLAVKTRIMQASSNDCRLMTSALPPSASAARNYVSMVKNPMFTQRQSASLRTTQFKRMIENKTLGTDVQLKKPTP